MNPREPGFYRIRLPQASDYEGVNTPALESDLKKMDASEFVTAVTELKPRTPQAAKLSSQRTATSEEIESGQRVWWLLLLGAFVLFVSEAIFARG